MSLFWIYHLIVFLFLKQQKCELSVTTIWLSDTRNKIYRSTIMETRMELVLELNQLMVFTYGCGCVMAKLTQLLYFQSVQLCFIHTFICNKEINFHWKILQVSPSMFADILCAHQKLPSIGNWVKYSPLHHIFTFHPCP